MAKDGTFRARRLALRSFPAALCLATVAAHPAEASPVTYEYTGVITSADASTGVAPGTPFSGTFTYDPAEKPSLAMSIEGSLQTFYGTASGNPGSVPDSSGIALEVGGRPIYSYEGGLQVAVNEPDGKYGYGDGQGHLAGPNMDVIISNDGVDGPLEVSLALKNPSQAPLTSLEPPTSLSLADFPLATLDVTRLDDPGSTTLYTGTIETLTPVPEPATAAVLGLGLLACLARDRRRDRRAS